jgi:hypothetical protein
MDVSQSRFGQDAQGSSPSAPDPRLQPTPDYGTLGPGSDFAASKLGSDQWPIQRTPTQPAKVRLVIAMGLALGIFSTLLPLLIVNRHVDGPYFADANLPKPSSAKDSQQLDRMRPQKQAEALLELAVAHSDGALDQISARVDRWHGRLHWDSEMATVITAALNSNDLQVRQSGIEIELAAYGLNKNSKSLAYVLRTAESSDHSRKIWALWALGLLGNRGVGTDRVVPVLASHLNDADEDSRRWAVEGLALVGTSDAIPLLLATMHDDPSALVRERAACSIAASGMFSPEQRQIAIPQLLKYTADLKLDAQTHTWAFAALKDITGQRLPNDAQAWQSWYKSQRSGDRAE